jgi:HK97 family phage portal protein
MSFINQVMTLLRGETAGPQAKLPQATYPTPGVAVLGVADRRLASKTNAQIYREWSLTPWVRAAIKIRREQIASADWDIVPYDKDEPFDRGLARHIRNLLDTPNAKLVSFHSFVQEVLEDLLVLDAAAIEKVRNPAGEIAELWPIPGEFIWVDVDWDGTDPDRPRYYYVPDGIIHATFRNQDLIYMVDNPRTVSPVGISPIEVLREVLDAEMRALRYNRRMLSNAPPEGVLNLGENANDEAVTRFRSRWESETAGRGGLAVVGGYRGLQWLPFRASNRDMQFSEWVELLIRCIAVVYGLSPMDLGITYDVNRSTAQQQAENTMDRGLRPLLDLFQRYITREIVWDDGFGGQDNNLSFVFSSLNLRESEQKAAINKVAVGGAPWKTINEARIMDGRAPIGDLTDENNIFNHILLATPKGLLDLTDGRYVGDVLPTSAPEVPAG